MAPPRPRTGGDADTPSRTHGPTGGTPQSVSGAQDATFRSAEIGRPGQAQQLALPPGNPTTNTLSQVRNMRNPRDRWQAGEQYVQELYGGAPGGHHPVATSNDPDFPVTTPGGRHVDTEVTLPNGDTMAIEVKTYQNWRTVQTASGPQAQQVEVPLNNHILEQVNKDVALRRTDPSYDPRWVFVNAGPSPELRQHLTDAGIVFVEHS